jgi:hypothetical protein
MDADITQTMLAATVSHSEGTSSAGKAGLAAAGGILSALAADREEGALGAGAQAMLVPGTVNQRLERGAPARIERTDALRRVELMAGDRQQVDAERVDSGRDLADRLRRVRVEADAVLAGDGADLFDRLDRADLVVGACMTLIRTVRAVIARRTSSGSTRPAASTGR